MKNQRKCLFLTVLVPLMLLSAASCKSTPPPQPAISPDAQPPGQDALDEMNAAMERAAKARQMALDVQGQNYFPDEWKQGESDNENGKNARKNTVGGVRSATASFTSAAETFESIAEKSAPLYAKDLEDARAALAAASARADQSQKDALAIGGQKYFPDEWEAAQTMRQNGIDAPAGTLAEMKTAAGLFTTAADGFDAIAEKSRPIFAEEKDAAMRSMQASLARAEQSRKDAQAVRANTYFPNDWKAAETQFQTCKSAKQNTLDEISAAAALFAATADMYDDLAGKSRPMAEKEDAQKGLNAAIARAEKSRQQAVDVDGQTYFPNDWKNAEMKNTSAKNAKRSTAEEITAAVALYVSAADAYDDIAKKSGPKFAKDKEDAQKALNAAIARAEKSRKDATDAKGQTNFPNDWKNAETKNTTAKNAKRGTPAEIKAAVPLYTSAADAYDDIVRKSASEETQKVAQAAKTRAEKERQGALDAKANIAAAADFNAADKIYQQAVKDFNGKTYGSATDNYGKSADQFTAAAKAAGGKRGLAGDAIEKAKQRSAESAAFAVNTGLALEENDEQI